MTDAELIAELSLPAYAGKTATQKTDMLNAPKQGVIIPVMVPKGDMLLAISACHERIAAKSEPERTMWYQLLATLRSLSEGIYVNHPAVVSFFAKAVLASVLTQDEVDYVQSLGVRTGSRAEELWGAGFTVSLNDVARVS
ncbi:hypothetical protein GC170_14530 [bacterium]|nr:hypothetical protein [bacterium]